MKKEDMKSSGLIEAFMYSMLDNVSDLVFVKNMDLVYIGASQSFADMVGVADTSEVIGKTDAQLFDDVELARRYTDDDRQLISSRQPLKSYIEPSISKGNRGYYHTSKFPLFDEQGNTIGLYAISKDVTMEYKAKLNYEQELRALFELPADATAAALFDISNWRVVDFKIVADDFHVDVNYESMDMFVKGMSDSVADDQAVIDFYHTFSQDNLRLMFESGRRHITQEYRCRMVEGDVHWMRSDLHFLLDPVTGSLSTVWILRDVEEIKQAEHALTRAAEWDSLTNVYNREATMTHIRRFLTEEGAEGIHWLFMIDVDNFKLVNDTFGHRAGDDTLVGIAAAIRSVFRETDIVGRVGGDEFFALMKNASEQQIVARRAKSLVEALQYVCSEEDVKVSLSGSVGISRYGGDGKTLERLYTEADSALYKAKQAGKNRFAFAEEIEAGAAVGPKENQDTINAIHLQTLLENMDAAMFQTEFAGGKDIDVTYSSHGLFSKEQEDAERTGARGENIWNVILPEDLEPLKDAIRDVMVSGEPLDHVCRVRNAFGRVEWRHIRGTHLPDQGDGIRRMIHVATDVTKQKQVEAELREKDSIIEFAMRNTDVNLWYFDYEREECQLTKSCQKAHEMSSIEVLSGFPECLIDMDYVREDSIELLLSSYKQLHETGENVEFDAWFRKADGSGWWCERDMLSPLMHRDGRVTKGIGIGKNVTAEKELEEKFHTFQSYRFLTEKNTLISVRMNLTTGWCGDYVSTDASVPQILQADTVDAFLRSAIKNVPTKEEAQVLPRLSRQYLLKAFIEGQDSIHIEHRWKSRDGSPIWMRAVVDMMRNPTNGDVEALYYAFDINYEKNMNFVVNQLLTDDYEFLGLVDVASGRLMVFGNGANELDTAQNGTNYEVEMERVFRGLLLEEYFDEGIRTMARDHVMKELETRDCYTCSFPTRAVGHTRAGRKQWKFSYLDDSKSSILMTRTDITSMYTAERDPLTGLYNRETFYRRTRQVLDGDKEHSFILIRFDIDRFKAYNDVYGVKAGDRLLAELGREVRNQEWPESSVFGRLDADHFVCLLPEEQFDIRAWHQRQSGFLEKTVSGYHLTSSVGIYPVTERSMDISLMCDRALLALRSVKDSYTNKLAWYDEGMRNRLIREQTMVDDMELALMQNQFVIYFQPQVNYNSGTLIGSEALVRWKHPKHGLIPPDEFISIFEKNGFILKMDMYVWEKSCEYMRRWLDQEEVFAPVPTSVNISRYDLYDPGLCEKLYSLVQKYRIPVSMLNLEITESAYMDDPEQLTGVVKELRSMGFTVEMDDFGAGYSSLNMLKDVPVDVLKLDTRFLSQCENDERAATILSAIIRMAQDLELSVITEGVETKAQADYLQGLNCFNMQGYYFGRPMPAEEFELLIKKQAGYKHTT